MKISKLFTIGFLAFISAVFITACVDQEFDIPPAVQVQETDISNTTISDLKQLHNINDDATMLSNQIIKGVVVSDDTNGNIFKEMVIQDGSAAIHIRVDQTDLNIKFPRGRLVYVNCEKLFLGNFNGLKQLGIGAAGNNVDRIPSVLIDSIFTIGPKDQLIEVYDRKINELTDADLSRLIRLSDVEFNASEVGGTMADPGGSFAQNRTIEDCDGNDIVLRNSDFADLAAETIPGGGGTLTAIYTTFGDTKQLTIRDMDDVVMEGDRCDGSGGGGGGTGDGIPIGDLRAAFNSGTTTAPNGFIEGIVISDVDNLNTIDRNLYIQNGSTGIAIRFENSHSFALGTSLRIDVGGQELSEFNGLLQVNEVPNGNASEITSIGTITPTTVCIEDLNDNLDQYESTLVKIKSVQITGGATYGDSNISVEDMSGDIPMFTRFDAPFSGDNLPGGDVDLVGVVTDFNGSQIFIRNADDILAATTSDCSGGGGGGGGGNNGDPVDSVDETFDGQSDFDPVMIAGWLNTVETGNRSWQKREFDGNGYAQATAFNDNDPNMDTWLVTPPLNMDVITTLNFDSAKAFYTHDGLSVIISTDFDGSDVGSATWTSLGATVASQSDADHAFINSGDIDLSAYDGTAYIAFRHEGSSGSNTGTFRIDNIKID